MASEPSTKPRPRGADTTPVEALPPLSVWSDRVALRFAIFQAAFIAGVTAQKAGSNALFLSRADPENLPYLYVGAAVVVVLLTTGLARLLVPYSAARLLPIFVAADASLLVVLGVAAWLNVPYAAGGLYVVVEAGTSAISILFWARVSDAFGARDQRRVIGMISAAGMVGSIFGGTAVSIGARVVGVPLAVIVGSLMAPLALLLLMRVRGKPRTLTRVKPAPLREGVTYLASRGLPRAVAALVLLFAATGAVVDFVFRVTSAGAFDEVVLTTVFGILNASVGVFAAIVQATMTSRLLARMGVFWFAAIIPLITVVLATSTLALPTFAPLVFIFALKFVEMLGAYSFNTTAVTLLYNPMPENVRSQVRALIDGSIKKAGAAIAGAALIALVHIWSTSGFLIIAIGLSGGVLGLLPTVRRHYLVALDEKLGRRKRKSAPVDVVVTDRDTLRVLLRALESDDRLRVLVALRTLAREAALPRTMIDRLLAHHDEDVRREALRHLPHERDDALTERLVGLAYRQDAPAPARAAAVRGLRHCAHERAGVIAEKFLDDAAVKVRLAAVEVILSQGEHDAARAVLDTLVATLATADAETRRGVARVIGALDEVRYDRALASLIFDVAPSVRLQAVYAAGREQHETHIDALIRSLGDVEVRRAAADALLSYGPAVIAPLAARLSDTRDSAKTLPFRRHIPRLLARIGGAEAAHVLLNATPRDEAALQRTCIERLLEMVQNNPEVSIDDDARHAGIERRLRLARAYHDAAANLSTDDGPLAVKTLARLMLEREDQALRLGHLLIGLVGDLDRTMAAYRALTPIGRTARHARRRQDALDLLDHVLEKDRWRGVFMALVEDAAHPGPKLSVEDQVDALQASPDPLVRGYARKAAIALGRPVREVSRVRATVSGAEDLDANGEDMEEATLERAVAIAHNDLFEGLPLDDLAVIATVAKEREVPAGEVLYRQGDDGESLFILQSGRVHLHKDGIEVMVLEEGESAGQVSFLDRGARPVTATVSASGPARVLIIERGDLMDLFADRPALMQSFFAVVGARLRALLERE